MQRLFIGVKFCKTKGEAAGKLLHFLFSLVHGGNTANENMQA
jgi:hypothetical protein